VWDEQVAKEIRFQLAMLERLLTSYETLLARVAQFPEQEISLIETTALASVLHSFYNGLESIFQIVAKRIDDQPPANDRWHQTLLEQMTSTTPECNAVLTVETKIRLQEYLAFRHFYRHSYSFFLDWRRIALLIVPLPDVALTVRAEIEKWLDNPTPADQ
jgi:hypothetical protein